MAFVVRDINPTAFPTGGYEPMFPRAGETPPSAAAASSSTTTSDGLPDCVPLYDEVFHNHNDSSSQLFQPDFRLDTVCKLTGQRIRDLILKQWAQGFPYLMATLHYRNDNRNMTREYVDARTYFLESHGKPEPYSFNVLFIAKTNNVDLLAFKKLFNSNAIRWKNTTTEFLKASDEPQRQQRDPLVCSWLNYRMAVLCNIENGPFKEKLPEAAINFAIRAANAGVLLARDLAHQLKPHCVDFVPAKSTLSAELYPEDKVLSDNYLFPLRELVRELPQPATVKTFTIQLLPSSNPKDDMRQDKDRGVHFEFKCKCELIVGTPEGDKVIRRTYSFYIYPAPSYTTVKMEDFKKAHKIALFIAKHWGLEYQATLIPTHPQHDKIRPLTDMMTTFRIKDGVFQRNYAYPNDRLEINEDNIWESWKYDPKYDTVFFTILNGLAMKSDTTEKWDDIIKKAKVCRLVYENVRLDFPVQK